MIQETITQKRFFNINQDMKPKLEEKCLNDLKTVKQFEWVHTGLIDEEITNHIMSDVNYKKSKTYKWTFRARRGLIRGKDVVYERAQTQNKEAWRRKYGRLPIDDRCDMCNCVDTKKHIFEKCFGTSQLGKERWEKILEILNRKSTSKIDRFDAWWIYPNISIEEPAKFWRWGLSFDPWWGMIGVIPKSAKDYLIEIGAVKNKEEATSMA